MCIVLIIGMVGAVAYYTNLVNDKNARIDYLQSDYYYYKVTHSHSNIEYAYLQDDFDNYKTTHSHLDEDYDILQAPSLLAVNLTGTDNRPLLGMSYLYLSGYICNVGTNTAYNFRLHVVAYQGAGSRIESDFNLDTISGRSWISVNMAGFYYSGNALTNWTLTLRWTATP